MSKCQWRCDHCDHLYDEKKGCGDECELPIITKMREAIKDIEKQDSNWCRGDSIDLSLLWEVKKLLGETL